MADEGAIGAVDMLQVRLWRRQRSCTSLPSCLVQRARPPRNGAQSAHLPSVETSVARFRGPARLGLKGGTNMRYLSFALATAASIAIATPAVAGPTEDFHALMDDYWAAYLKDNPLIASSVGVKTYDRQLGELSLAEFDRQAAEAQALLTRLRAIPRRPAQPDGPEQPRGARADLGRPDRAQSLWPAPAALLLARQLSRVPCDHGREHPHADQGGLRQLSRAARARARPDEGLRRHERESRERRLHAGLRVDEDVARLDRRAGPGGRHQVAFLRPVRRGPPAGSFRSRLVQPAGACARGDRRTDRGFLSRLLERRREAARAEVPQGRFRLRSTKRQCLLRRPGRPAHDDRTLRPTRSTRSACRRSHASARRWSRSRRRRASPAAKR